MICVWDSSSPLICFMTVTCYNKLIEQHHLMKISSMQSKYGIQEQIRQMINEPYHHLSVHIYSSKKDVCITLLIASEFNKGESDDTTSAGRVWQGNEIWSCFLSHFCCWAEEIILLFFCLCYCIVTSGKDRQQNMLCSVPFYYYGMYVYVGWEKE